MSENYYLDRQQREYLLKDLATLLEHIRDLDNVLTRQTRYHGQGRHSADSPLPFSVQASDFRHEIAAALPGICEILGYTTPFAHTTSIIDCLTWLSRNHMKLAAYEDAEKLADDIASWARRIVTIVDRPKYPDFIGKCPNCRANDLSETMAAAQSRIATSLEEERNQATKLNPNWEIIFSRGNVFFLINKNGEDAFDVHISTSSVYKPEKTEQSITAGSSVEIRGELGNTVNNNWVQVTWNRPPETQDGHRYTWQGSFPRQK